MLDAGTVKGGWSHTQILRVQSATVTRGAGSTDTLGTQKTRVTVVPVCQTFPESRKKKYLQSQAQLHGRTPASMKRFAFFYR
jgi:predicted AlkP superfamily phosphohydrolase/phosphomutase